MTRLVPVEVFPLAVERIADCLTCKIRSDRRWQGEFSKLALQAGNTGWPLGPGPALKPRLSDCPQHAIVQSACAGTIPKASMQMIVAKKSVLAKLDFKGAALLNSESLL